MKQRVVHKSKAKADMVYTIQQKGETLLNHSGRLNQKHKTDDPNSQERHATKNYRCTKKKRNHSTFQDIHIVLKHKIF